KVAPIEELAVDPDMGPVGGIGLRRSLDNPGEHSSADDAVVNEKSVHLMEISMPQKFQHPRRRRTQGVRRTAGPRESDQTGHASTSRRGRSSNRSNSVTAARSKISARSA